MSNQLANERSPYLLSHRENPVDWLPWGEAAFARARAEDKPVFVSIGYAACHWCHVMAHESFEDPAIAEVMNDLFVNIKVDREERPEVDAVYMNAIHVMGEGGGWPLSAFCDSDGKPFFMGTYFPPDNRYGRPGFRDVLETMARVYREDRERAKRNGEAILESLQHMDEHFRRGAVGADVGVLSQSLLIAAGRKLVQKADPERGGFGQKPKFPSSPAHELLARASRYSFGEPAREAFLRQADHMASGGIYDHLGGGFARYSVDQWWLVPHFEKMLYDNAQLLAIYATAFAMTGEARYERVIAETVAWLSREMKDPAGGLYASLDADSEGEEGKFYVWTPDEIRAVLGAADGIVFCRTYGVTEGGNFEGQNVLSRVAPEAFGGDEAALVDMRRRLLEARGQRVRPATDDKILASWNGLAIHGLVSAWEATGHEPALALAREVADFLAREMIRDDGGRILRVYKDGSAALDGTLEDYAFCARGLMALASATGEERMWTLGKNLTASLVDRFHERTEGIDVFFMTAVDAGDGLIHRPESTTDGATPAAAAVAVECLVLAGMVCGDGESMELAERYLAGRAPQASEEPFAASRILCALDLYLNGEVAVVTEGEGRDALLLALRRAFSPTRVIAGEWAAAEILADKKPSASGGAQLYLCRGQTCSPPITDPTAIGARGQGLSSETR